MSRIISIIIFIIALGSFISAQEIVSPCSTIEVKGEMGVVQPGDVMTFTAVIDGDLQKYPIKYKWTIDKGTIIEGQGENIIQVDTTGLEDATIKATLEVIGLPENCNNSASEINVVACLCIGDPIPPIGDISKNQIRAEIDNVFIRLQFNPTNTAYLITYGKIKEIEKREKVIEAHIKLRRYDRKRIIFLNSAEETKIRTEVYIIPEGVEPPTP